MAYIGSCFQILGVLTGLPALIFYGLGIRYGKRDFRFFGNLFTIAMFIFVTLTVTCLFLLVLHNDFLTRYVAVYSDRTLPFAYKISVLWTGQSGALLTCCFFLSFFCVVGLWLSNKWHEKYACAMNFINVTFIVLLLGAAVFGLNPFIQLEYIPVNGRGLLPQLQNKYIFLFPILRCFWVAGALAIFSRALATLFVRDISSHWIKTSYPYMIFSWLSLLAAIILKSLWVYDISGKFWKWGLEEMTTALAFLTVTALMRTSTAYRLRGRLKIGTFLCALLFFQTALFSCYIVHSDHQIGTVPFKHTFHGSYIIGLMLLSCLVYIFFLNANKNEIALNRSFMKKTEYTIFKTLNISFAIAVSFILGGLLFKMITGGLSNSYGYYLVAMIPSALFALFFIFTEQIFHLLKNENALAKTKKINIGAVASYSGILIIIVVVILSYLYSWNTNIYIYPGEKVYFKGITVTDNGVNSAQKANYVTTYVDIALSSNKKVIGNIQPELRGYNNSKKLIAETKTVVSGLGIVTAAFLRYDFLSHEARLLVMNRPFVLLMIPGIMLFTFGMLWAARSNRNN